MHFIREDACKTHNFFFFKMKGTLIRPYMIVHAWAIEAYGLTAVSIVFYHIYACTFIKVDACNIQ